MNLILCGLASGLTIKKSEKLDKILRFGPFFRSPGAAEMAVDFLELLVRDAQQADCGAGLD